MEYLIALLEYIDLIHSHIDIVYTKHLRKQATNIEWARVPPYPLLAMVNYTTIINYTHVITPAWDY